MTVMRFTIIDNAGTISFVAPWNTLKALVAGCSAKPTPTSYQELVENAAKYDSRLRGYVFDGLSVFDEHYTTAAVDDSTSVLNPTLDAQLASILGKASPERVTDTTEELEEIPFEGVPETVSFSDLEAYQQSLNNNTLAEHPVLRVIDEATRNQSLEPFKAGLVIFNLLARRIVQVQNSYGVLRRSDRGRYFENGQPTDRLYFYRLPPEWSMVP